MNLSSESAEIPRNLSQENPVKMSTAFPRNFSYPILRHQVRGISCNPFRGNSRNSIQGISCNQFQGISCYQFCRKTGENVDKICGNSWDFPEKSSSEPIPGNFQGTILKIFARFHQEYLDIFSAYSFHIH